MVDIAGTVSKGWMAAAIGVAFDRDYYFDPARRHVIDSACNAHLQEHAADLNLLFTESNLGRLDYYDPTQVLVGGIQPNMIVGMLLGADFVPSAHMDADISPTPLAGRGPDDLPSVDSLLRHELIRLLDDQYRAVQREGILQPVPPFFWDSSGRAAIHGALTTAQKLLGESIFMDIATDPERCQKVFDWLTDLSIALVRHFAGLAERPIDEVHVGECSGCMVSPVLYERLVVPTLSRIGRELGSVRWHSCGDSDHLLKAAQQIENLSELDLGGGTSIKQVRKVFGRRLPVCIAPLVDDLRANDPKGLLDWADRVLGANAGGPLTVGYHLEPGYSLDHLRRLHGRVLAATPDLP